MILDKVDPNLLIIHSSDTLMNQQHPKRTRRITNPSSLLLQFIIVAVLALYTGLRTHHEYREQEELSSRTDRVIWVTWVSHTVLTVSTARQSADSVPVREAETSKAGGLLIGTGTAMYALGTAQFESVDQMMGRNTNGLLTDGIFSYSRNPQYTGWGVVLLGIATRRWSGLTFLSAGFYWVVIHCYLLFVEEPHLERVFGEDYNQYRSNVPRYISLSRGKREETDRRKEKNRS